MKKDIICLLIAAMLTGLAGCAQKEETPAETVSVEAAPSGILVPAAQFQMVKLDIDNMMNYCWIDDTLLYTEWQWLEEADSRKKTLCQANLDGTGEPRIVLEEIPGEFYFDMFFSDRDNSLYLFGREQSDGQERYYMKKLDSDGQEIYCTYMEKQPPHMTGPASISYGYADYQGNILLKSMDGYLYLFNNQGEYLNSFPSVLSQPSFLDAGEKGVFLWERISGTTEVTMTEIDWKRSTVGEPFTVNMPGMENSYTSFTLLSGYEKGILLSSEDTLWQYDPDTGSLTELLDWQTPDISINGSEVLALRFPDKGKNGNLNMDVLCYSWQDSQAETASITYVDQAALPKRQTLTIGVSNALGIKKALRNFNRTNPDYEVQLREYDTYTMVDSLMYGKEDIPDLLDINWIDPDLLVNKGLLEDLEPFFNSSSAVSKEDILESVWNAGIVNGKMTGAITSFDINALATWAEEIPDTGWTYEDFFALDRAYPESRLTSYFSQTSVYKLLMNTGMNQFVDFEKKKCYFDSPEYVELLKKINGLNYPEASNNSHSRITYMDEETKKFLSGEFILMADFYTSPYQYQTAMDQYQGKASVVGYPTQDGEPWYLISPRMNLAIYSNSPCKEGAWAFIEFLLSEQEQNWYGRNGNGFPVRKDSFETYLNRPHMPGTVMKDEKPSEEYREDLRYMAGHLYTDQNINTSSIIDIMHEETESYFQGGKTAEEAAGIIQNRVQLYLDEMK